MERAMVIGDRRTVHLKQAHAGLLNHEDALVLG